MRSINDILFEGLRHAGYPLILTDDLGVRFVLYPWNKTPTWKLRGKYHMRKEFSAFEKLIAPGSVVADVGANIGIHSVMMSRRADTVYAFEPTKETFQHLKENLALNNAENVIPIEVAISDSVGTAEFHLFEQETAEWNSLKSRHTEKGDPVQSREVVVTTLDAIMESRGIHKFDFVKIDVEGLEKEVFLGAANALTDKKIAALSFEVWRDEPGGTPPNELIATLNGFGYAAHVYDEKAGIFTRIQGSYTPLFANENLYAFPD